MFIICVFEVGSLDSNIFLRFGGSLVEFGNRVFFVAHLSWKGERLHNMLTNRGGRGHTSYVSRGLPLEANAVRLMPGFRPDWKRDSHTAI